MKMHKQLIYPSLPQGSIVKAHGRMEMIKKITQLFTLIRNILFYFPSLIMLMMGDAMIQYIEQKPTRVSRRVHEMEDGVGCDVYGEKREEENRETM